MRLNLSAGGVAYYEGNARVHRILRLRKWIEAIEQDQGASRNTEQAYVVSQILEALYESAHTGKAVYLNNASEA